LTKTPSFSIPSLIFTFSVYQLDHVIEDTFNRTMKAIEESHKSIKEELSGKQ